MSVSLSWQTLVLLGLLIGGAVALALAGDTASASTLAGAAGGYILGNLPRGGTPAKTSPPPELDK